MLTVRDHMAIRLAAARYKFEGARATAVREELRMSAPRFWQYVNALLDDPAALEAYPLDVRRLRRLRDARRRARRATSVERLRLTTM